MHSTINSPSTKESGLKIGGPVAVEVLIATPFSFPFCQVIFGAFGRNMRNDFQESKAFRPVATGNSCEECPEWATTTC